MRLGIGVLMLALAVVIGIAAVRGTQGKVWRAITGGGSSPAPGTAAAAAPTLVTPGQPPATPGTGGSGPYPTGGGMPTYVGGPTPTDTTVAQGVLV